MCIYRQSILILMNIASGSHLRLRFQVLCIHLFINSPTDLIGITLINYNTYHFLIKDQTHTRDAQIQINFYDHSQITILKEKIIIKPYKVCRTTT